MPEQISYQDIQVGDMLPAISKDITARRLVKWAYASGDYYEMHYNRDFAESWNLPGIITQGDLLAAFMSQLITDWVSGAGSLKKLTTQNRQMVFHNQTIWIKGAVTRKFIEKGENLVECDVWIETEKGEKPVSGKAIARFN